MQKSIPEAKTMNKRERFEAFLHNQPVDRVPVAFFHHYTTQAEYVTGLRDPALFEKMVMRQRVTRVQDDPDILKIMNDVLMMMPVDVSAVKGPEDLDKIVPPSMDSLYVSKTKELTERVLDYYKGEDIPSFATGFSPVFCLRFALMFGLGPKQDRLKEFFLAAPEKGLAALKILEERINEIHTMLIRDFGLDGIYFSVNNQNQLLPDEVYREYCVPIEQEMVREINKNGLSFLHICGFGGLINNLELFREYDASVINWAVHAEGVSLKEGKTFFGGKPVMGGFAQDEIIYRGTEEEVKTEVKRILAEAGQTGVMIGADCTVPEDIDERRFGWARDAAREFAEETSSR